MWWVISNQLIRKGKKSASEREETKSMPELNPEMVEKLSQLRAQVRENFGKVVMTMMMLGRYRHSTLSDMQHLVLDPLIRDRIAVGQHKTTDENPLADMAGIVVWATVSDEVEAKIRDQIKSGVWPIRLTADEWTSGDNMWLLDLIAPNKELAESLLIGFGRKAAGKGDLRLHPIVRNLVDGDVLERMTKGRERADA